MAKSIWDELPPPGKLDEGPDPLMLLLEAGHPRGRQIYVCFRAGALPKIATPNPDGRRDARIGGPIFLRMTHVRRPRFEPNLPRAVRVKTHVALWPLRSDVAFVRGAGAKRRGRDRVWSIARESMTAELAALTGPVALERMLRVANRCAVRPGAVARYQQYLDGVAPSKSSRQAARIEAVEGEVAFLGNIGRDPVVRAVFWTEFEPTLRSAAARIQYRILLCLPAYFTPAERRAAVELFAVRMFEPLGIRWAATIHRPMPNAEGAEATFHVHFTFAPVEPARMRSFRADKNRGYLERKWLETAKQTAADIFNEIHARSTRRTGKSSGEPLFFVAKKSPDRKRNPDFERRLWRADRKRELVGLPTSAQLQALAERTDLPTWMSLEPFAPSLEAAIRLWRALVPAERQHEPQVSKALAHLRTWAAELLETFQAEMAEAFEVATYLSLPLRTRRSELMEIAADRLWRIRPGHIENLGRSEYLTAYDDLFAKARQGDKATGQFRREYMDTIAAIEAVEGIPLKRVVKERFELAVYHALMVRTLKARAHIFEQLEATIRRIEALRLADLARPNDPETINVGIAVDLAANGYGVTLPGPGRNGVFQDGSNVRPYTVQLDGTAKAKEYLGGRDDPWLQDVPLTLAESFPRIWSEARTRVRRAMHERAAVLDGLNRQRDTREVRPSPPMPSRQQQVVAHSGGNQAVPQGGPKPEAGIPVQSTTAHSSGEGKQLTIAEILAARRLPRQRPGHEH